MLEFSINEQNYRAGKLNAFQQLHVSRKIAPILPKLLPAFAAVASAFPEKKDDEDQPAPDLSIIGSALAPAAEALAAIPDADCEFVYGTCLGVVSRQQDKSWASVWNASSKALMFDDIQLGEMTQIVIKVIQDSLGGFMQGLLAKAQASSPEAA